MRAAHLLAPLAPLALAAACGPGFTPFREVEKPRVVGAMVSVEGNPSKATPAPGETATLRLVVADPGPKTPRTYGLVVCRPGASQLDIVFCDDASRIVTTAFVPSAPDPGQPIPDPEVRFTVPDLATLGDAEELWVQGAVCNNGTVRDLVADPPVAGEPWDACEPDPTADPQPVGQVVTMRIKLHLDDESLNHAPTLAGLTLDGMPWTAVAPDDAPTTGCAGQGYPEVAAAGDVAVRIAATSDDASRETFTPFGFETPVREDLFLFLFRTAGDPSPTFGTIDDTSAEAVVEWTPPPVAQVDPTGTLVRFWAQLQDERNASVFVPRALCLTRP